MPPVNRTQDTKATKYTSELRTSTRRRIAENDTLQPSYDDKLDNGEAESTLGDDSSSFYRHLQGRRTSSLNVLNDQDDGDDDEERYNSKFDDEPLTPRSTTSSITHSIGYDGENNTSRTSHQSNQARERQRRSDDTASDTMDDDTGSDSLDSLDSMKLGDDDDDDDTNNNDGNDGDHGNGDSIHDLPQGNSDESSNNNDLIYDAGTITFLHKAVDEDIVRTLPSLCVFQASIIPTVQGKSTHTLSSIA